MPYKLRVVPLPPAHSTGAPDGSASLDVSALEEALAGVEVRLDDAEADGWTLVGKIDSGDGQWVAFIVHKP